MGSSARVRIAGLGKALPERVVTNAELSERLGLDADWIEVRTGVRERRFGGPDDTATSLGLQAARLALESAGVAAGDLDLVVVATCTPDHPMPPTSSQIQDALGASRAGALDLNTACSGFVYGLATAAGLASGGLERVLVIGVDLLSRFIDPMDASTAVLFGDGAGAALVVRDPGAEPVRFVLGSDGSATDQVIIPAGGSKLPPSRETVDGGLHYLRMAGRPVYRHAVRTITNLAAALGSDVDLVVCHQANRRILEECADQLGIDREKVFVNIDRYGNTSAGSVPIALTEAWEQGRLGIGDKVMLIGFGAGYTWAGATLRWNMPRTRTRDSQDLPTEEPQLSEVRR